jgi:hypothetical protein
MHISIPVPHPLARLTRVIAALEKGRTGGDPRHAFVQANPLVPPAGAGAEAEARIETSGVYAHDLETLSLSRSGSSPEPRSHDLEFLSLSAVEGTGSGRRDSLGDLSLERSFPPRPEL